MTNIAKHLLAASAALLAAGGAVVVAASPAMAKDVTVYGQEPEVGPTRTVSYADLNLAQAAGQKMLNRRVSRAVRYVCGPSNSGGLDFNYTDCINFAWAGARPQIASAIERAQQLAATGASSIAPVAIAIRGAAQ